MPRESAENPGLAENPRHRVAVPPSLTAFSALVLPGAGRRSENTARGAALKEAFLTSRIPPDAKAEMKIMFGDIKKNTAREKILKHTPQKTRAIIIKN
jgi:hypothetical protein